MDKQGKSKNIWLFVVGAVILGVAFGYINLPSNLSGIFSGVSSPGTQSTITTAESCIGVEDTTVTLDAVRKFSTGTALAGRHYYRLKDGGNWGSWSNIADAGTFTASPGDALEVIFALTGGSTANGHYALAKEYTVPCKGAWTVTEEVVQSGTPTVRVYSEDNGNLLDSGGVENETAGSGDLINLKLEFQNAFETGNPHGYVVVARWNRTSVDDVTLTIDGKELPITGIPVRYTTTTANHVQKAYLFPGIIDSQVHVGSVRVDVDDTNNPETCVGTGDICAVNLTFLSRNNFLTDTDEVGLGAEDSDDNNRTGQADMNLGSFYLD